MSKEIEQEIAAKRKEIAELRGQIRRLLLQIQELRHEDKRDEDL